MDSPEELWVFDTASQVSFIRTELARTLNLIPMKEHHLHLSNFTTKQPLEVWCAVYEVLVKATDGKKMRLKVHGLDKLLGSVAVVNVKPNPNRATSNENAWSVTGCMAEVDLIIGSDNYFDFDIRQIAMYHETLRVLDSKVGLIAAGFLPISLKYAWEHLVPNVNCYDVTGRNVTTLMTTLCKGHGLRHLARGIVADCDMFNYRLR